MRVLIRIFPVVAVIAAAALYATQRPVERVKDVNVIVTGEGGCADQELRIAALDAVLQMEADRAMPILLKVLGRRDDCSEELRRKAVFLVSQQGGAEAAEVLLQVVRDDPSTKVRKQAVFWLSQVPGDRAVAGIEYVLEETAQLELREQAIFALSQHPSPRSEEILRSFAARDNAPVELREKAIFWLGNEGSQESQDFLRDLFTGVSNEQLKEKILFAVSQQASHGSGGWLLTVVNDRDETIEIRKNALFWLGQEHGLRAADLDGVYESAGAPELKEQVLFVLSQTEESWAVAQLIDIARGETDPELRKKALFWLGQSSDPRAAEFLLEVIEQ